MVLLLQNGRCYEAEICAILLLLRRPFRWNPFFAQVKIFIFRPKTMDYSPWFDFWESKKTFEKRIATERASQMDQNSARFSFVAPYSEEL